ncbi:hypothetical protein RJ639_034825 [Escallonia herrerae]|uniref:RING-CH-type domain-containing protein n=1 Tax=Escallonia herrerae TaxID=1293975 RepID=A0AA88X338_9ASTE|nr:hypothetical protein RJ639_034825 [Escallonia herrerae]
MSENSGSSVDGAGSETVIVVRSHDEHLACVSGENKDVMHTSAKGNGLDDEVKKVKELEGGKESCVIDVKCGIGENLEGERVCRICHLGCDLTQESATIGSASASTTANGNGIGMDLMQLGCGCKDELGIAHSHCAETWFKLKGNRLCEICGETAKNITGVQDIRFMEGWNDIQSTGGVQQSERRRGCWRGQPFCNFLMACLVIAFVLPWFFRVNMF